MNIPPGSIERVITLYQVGLKMFLFMQATLLFLWSFTSIVEGMGDTLYMEAGFHAVSHIGFWLAIEIIIVFIGCSTLTILPNKKKTNNANHINRVLIFYQVILVIGIIANIIHIVACGMELGRKTSILAMKNNGILVAILIIYAVLIVIESASIYYSYKYRQVLKLKIK